MQACTSADAAVLLSPLPPCMYAATCRCGMSTLADPLSLPLCMHSPPKLAPPFSPCMRYGSIGWLLIPPTHTCTSSHRPLPACTTKYLQMRYGSIGWSVGAALGYAFACGPKSRALSPVVPNGLDMAEEVSELPMVIPVP